MILSQSSFYSTPPDFENLTIYLSYFYQSKFSSFSESITTIVETSNFSITLYMIARDLSSVPPKILMMVPEEYRVWISGTTNYAN